MRWGREDIPLIQNPFLGKKTSFVLQIYARKLLYNTINSMSRTTVVLIDSVVDK